MSKKFVVNIKLNGTDRNPYHALGFKQNPFPHHGANHMLNNLEAEPIKDLYDLRTRMKGCSEELINYCCNKFEKGKMVKFKVWFEE